MKNLKLFESFTNEEENNFLVTKDNFKNYVLGPMNKILGNVPDNRETAKLGDIVLAVWYPDQEWYAVKLEKTSAENEDQIGLGFAGDGKCGTADTVYDIGGAYHCIVLK